MVFVCPNLLQTISEDKTIYVEAHISESFPVGKAFRDIGQFVSILESVGAAPEIEWEEDRVRVKTEGFNLTLTYDNPVFIDYPNGRPKKAAPLASFHIEKAYLVQIIKMLKSYKVTKFALASVEGNLFFSNADQKTEFSFGVSTPNIVPTQDFFYVFDMNMFKVLPLGDCIFIPLEDRRMVVEAKGEIYYHFIADKKSKLGKQTND